MLPCWRRSGNLIPTFTMVLTPTSTPSPDQTSCLGYQKMETSLTLSGDDNVIHDNNDMNISAFLPTNDKKVSDIIFYSQLDFKSYECNGL